MPKFNIKTFGNEGATKWWNSLSIDEKVIAKTKFEALRLADLKRKKPKYSDLYDLTNIRISKLGVKHITRIFLLQKYL